jgi:hypothetical protein
MFKIWDNEGETVVTLTDINTEEQFEKRLADMDEEVVEMCGDTPDWGRKVEDDEDTSFAEQLTMTFDAWGADCAKWVKKCKDQVGE